MLGQHVHIGSPEVEVFRRTEAGPAPHKTSPQGALLAPNTLPVHGAAVHGNEATPLHMGKANTARDLLPGGEQGSPTEAALADGGCQGFFQAKEHDRLGYLGLLSTMPNGPAFCLAQRASQ